MSASANKKRAAAPTAPVTGNPAQPQVGGAKTNVSSTKSKQSRVIAMLQDPAGATIATIVKATGWQKHSVRGFLAAVVRKRLKLKLASEKVDGARVYQIPTGGEAKSERRRSKARSR